MHLCFSQSLRLKSFQFFLHHSAYHFWQLIYDVRNKRMKKYFNITAGYSLVNSAIHQLYELYERFDYFEDFVNYSEDIFLLNIHKPNKYSLLHIFLENISYESLEEALTSIDPSEMIEEINHFMNYTGIPTPNWFSDIDNPKYKNKLMKIAEKVAHNEAKAAFEILFRDKEFLLDFQLRIKKVVDNNLDKNLPLFNKNGNIKRARIPEWLKKAIFFRDKGKCQLCGKDISGLSNHYNELNYDHLLPLGAGGTNDSTNYILLCRECNQKKKVKVIKFENKEEFWFKE